MMFYGFSGGDKKEKTKKNKKMWWRSRSSTAPSLEASQLVNPLKPKKPTEPPPRAVNQVYQQGLL